MRDELGSKGDPAQTRRSKHWIAPVPDLYVASPRRLGVLLRTTDETIRWSVAADSEERSPPKLATLSS